ncbi:MAG: SCO family protein [Chloroflexi bacterium]|nr:SCO family protein [Chloroflexota bacterium]MDA0246275.1 SCO family protein [Chloroflexota bacterium]
MSSTTTTANTRHKRWLIFLATAFLVVGLFGGWVAIQFANGSWRLTPPSYKGMTLQSPELLPDIEMMSTTGERVSLSDYRGKVVLLFFGYTSCPDICPATLLELRTAVRELGGDSDQIQVVMVTVDPQRDDVPRLKQYVTQFDERFIGLVGTDEELIASAAQYGIFYQAHEVEGSQAGYFMDHTAAIMAFDKDGYLRLMYPFGMTGGDIAADMRYLIKE